MPSADLVRCGWFEHGMRVLPGGPIRFHGRRPPMRSSERPAATASGGTSDRAWRPTPSTPVVRSDGAIPVPGDRTFVVSGEHRVSVGVLGRAGLPTLLPSVPARPSAGRGRRPPSRRRAIRPGLPPGGILGRDAGAPPPRPFAEGSDRKCGYVRRSGGVSRISIPTAWGSASRRRPPAAIPEPPPGSLFDPKRPGA